MDDFEAQIFAGVTGGQSDGFGKEEAFIRRLFSFHKMTKPFETLKARAKEDGLQHINFEYFHNKCPHFPLALYYGKIAYAHEEMLLQNVLKGKFFKGRIFKKFAEVCSDDNSAEHDHVGMVFQVANIGTFVLHDLLGDGDENGTFLVVNYQDYRLVLEQDEAFYVRVGNEWI